MKQCGLVERIPELDPGGSVAQCPVCLLVGACVSTLLDLMLLSGTQKDRKEGRERWGEGERGRKVGRERGREEGRGKGRECKRRKIFN